MITFVKLETSNKGGGLYELLQSRTNAGVHQNRNAKNSKGRTAFHEKTVIYRFLAIPLAAFSLFNLAAFLFHASADRESLISAGIFALLAALGLAFFKEAGYQHKQIQKTVHIYMLNRIKKSEILSEERKSSYARQIKEEPFAMRSFVEFLTEEDRRKKMY